MALDLSGRLILLGSYISRSNQLKRPLKEVTQSQQTEISTALVQLLTSIYGNDNITQYPEVGGHKFIAAYHKLLFETSSFPSTIQKTRIQAALMNNYNVEIIFFIADDNMMRHPQISYRYIGQYIDVMKSCGRTDLVRWINQFRNKIEEDYYEKIKKNVRKSAT